jgi:hypothetical protein
MSRWNRQKELTRLDRGSAQEEARPLEDILLDIIRLLKATDEDAGKHPIAEYLR